MLIVNDDHRMRAGVCSLDELYPYCGSAFASYPLIMSDDAAQTVYHVACALELATDLLVDLYTFFCPPAPMIACLLSPPPSDSEPIRRWLCSQRISKRSRPRCGSKRTISIHG